ncbi:hypothetical protein PINS_up002776 [Pythium insidiosum]|nr:hypothetical protein PINS_up002776 [Pythium insidiosum]
MTRLELRTSNNQELNVGATERCTSTLVNVGSGLIVGVEGRHGCMVDCLGFVFIDSIEMISLEIEGDATFTPITTSDETSQAIENRSDEGVRHEIRLEWTEQQRRSVQIEPTYGCFLRRGRDSIVRVRFATSDSPCESPEENAAFVLDANAVIDGREMVAQTSLSTTMIIHVSSRSRCVVKHRDSIVSASGLRSGRWIIQTLTGVHTCEFRGSFHTSRTSRTYTHTEQPLNEN